MVKVPVTVQKNGKTVNILCMYNVTTPRLGLEHLVTAKSQLSIFGSIRSYICGVDLPN